MKTFLAFAAIACIYAQGYVHASFGFDRALCYSPVIMIVVLALIASRGEKP